jgi:hypothetical protein
MIEEVTDLVKEGVVGLIGSESQVDRDRTVAAMNVLSLPGVHHWEEINRDARQDAAKMDAIEHQERVFSRSAE